MIFDDLYLDAQNDTTSNAVKRASRHFLFVLQYERDRAQRDCDKLRESMTKELADERSRDTSTYVQLQVALRKLDWFKAIDDDYALATHNDGEANSFIDAVNRLASVVTMVANTTLRRFQYFDPFKQRIDYHRDAIHFVADRDVFMILKDFRDWNATDAVEKMLRNEAAAAVAEAEREEKERIAKAERDRERWQKRARNAAEQFVIDNHSSEYPKYFAVSDTGVKKNDEPFHFATNGYYTHDATDADDAKRIAAEKNDEIAARKSA